MPSTDDTLNRLNPASGGRVTLNTGPRIQLGAAEPEPETDGLLGVDVEGEALTEISGVLKGFKERSQNDLDRFNDATDSEYWVAICFQTREQKEEWLRKTGLLELGDKYLDGMKVAQKMGIRLTARIPALPRFRLDRRLLELARR